jgi:hypothetical protein
MLENIGERTFINVSENIGECTCTFINISEEVTWGGNPAVQRFYQTGYPLL